MTFEGYMETCHYCEEPQAEHTCPRCGLPTCEDCFEPMTQWNAGWEIPCKECQNRSERAHLAESDRLHAEEQVKAEKRKKAAIAREKRYYSPESTAKRIEKRKARLEAKFVRAVLRSFRIR